MSPNSDNIQHSFYACRDVKDTSPLAAASSSRLSRRIGNTAFERSVSHHSPRSIIIIISKHPT